MDTYLTVSCVELNWDLSRTSKADDTKIGFRGTKQKGMKNKWNNLVNISKYYSRSRKVVNFTNILHEAFCTKILREGFLKNNLGLIFFWREFIGANELIKCWWNWQKKQTYFRMRAPKLSLKKSVWTNPI